MRRLWLIYVAVLAVAPAAASAGQQSAPAPDRAALLAAEREKKTEETTPPERSLVERALYWYDNQYVLPRITAGWNGFRLANGNFPAGAGTAAGVSFTRATGSHVTIDGNAAYSTRGYGRMLAGVTMTHLGGAPIDLRVSGQHYEYPQEDFFGLGPDSAVADRTNYLLEATEAGAELRWKPARLVDLSGGVTYVSPRIGTGTDSRYPSTESLFDVRRLPGFTAQSDYLRSDASAAFDWRDNPLHPHAGGRYGVQVSNVRDQDLNAYDFRQVSVDVQQYVPLPNRYRTLALRAAGVFSDADPGQEVPFYLQPTLGGASELRGFREFRFRDRNSLVLTAEYRWEAWWALDAALFVDAGTVAGQRRDLSLSNLDVSYGIGFRIHSNNAFVARLDLARSREGFIPLLRFEHVF
jgi:hypothetical protein